MIGNRHLSKILSAPFEKRHWKALILIFFRVRRPISFLYRYLTSKGTYPYIQQVTVRGITLSLPLDSHHDVMTINEIFCREDYKVKGDEKCIVDFGSNKGFASLYFLACCSQVHVFCFEPVPSNFEKLKQNIATHGFQNRAVLSHAAVDTTSGKVEFGIESSGRYGGIGLKLESSIHVECIEVNKALSEIISERGDIDLLKIDTEGNEHELMKSIHSSTLSHIRAICVEAESAIEIPSYSQKKRGYIFTYRKPSSC
jgi:FkbM family methyltransferase